MGRRNKHVYDMDAACDAVREGADPWKRQRKERINYSPYDLPKVDVHGILFAVVAVVFVVGANGVRTTTGAEAMP